MHNPHTSSNPCVSSGSYDTPRSQSTVVRRRPRNLSKISLARSGSGERSVASAPHPLLPRPFEGAPHPLLPRPFEGASVPVLMPLPNTWRALAIKPLRG